MIAEGNVVKQFGEDQNSLGQCMGEAIMEGFLKRKSF